ncbi:baculoviral IAP repeat-containing protein 7-like [Lingula anatina]|uniref:Baculoviral IAP repeat-containing protein 7-like n=1 Tax=Lingula anatina TaxID=7574 RepID=A0A1S3J9I1_LINAN|nr:baculoviral IAP repeat-containing protein 7-like [Lingula anatina]|eukprot:XP_013406876.1 baculoviral IAP repeat-containing protein 7-like [Lingula anatina]
MSIQKVTRLFFKNLQINGGHETPEYRFTSKETEQIPVTPTKPKLLPRHFFELRERFTFFSIKQVLPGYELGRHHTAKGESSDGQKGEYRFEANRINSFRNWPPASPASSLKLARAGLYYSGKGDEVVCFSCGGHLKQWQKGNDPQDKHRRSFPSCRQANGDDPRNVPLYERSFDETLADGMTDLFPNLAREQRSRESTGSSSSSYYGRLASALEASEFGSQSPTGRAARPYDVEPREIKARMDTELVQLVLGLGFERLSVQNAVEQRLRTTGDDFHSAESLVEAVLNITESIRQRVSQPEVPVTPPPRDLPREQSQMPNASPEVKASDRTCEPSGKKAMSPSSVPLDPDEASKILKEENLRLKEQRRCKICMDEEANIVFLPCGHLVSCAQCAPALRTCPICRSCIRGTVRTYN